MLHSIGLLLASILRLFRTRRSLLLENLALRQQLAVLKRKHPRPRLVALDRLFWVLARRLSISPARTGPHHCAPGDRGPLAPVWICVVLARHLKRAPSDREEKNL